MRIVKVKLFTVLLILIICISNSFPSIISERLKNASIKEQVHTNITTFLKNYEVYGYLEDVSSQEQSDVSINKSKLYDKVEVLFFPVDGKADNIDTSFFTSHDIKYIKAESLLQAS
ncbi:MAG: hypothetical protein LBS38_02655, partial [Endomicrobium sp.]|nr:hypothetical protein [Endomicrobium sp.]